MSKGTIILLVAGAVALYFIFGRRRTTGYPIYCPVAPINYSHNGVTPAYNSYSSPAPLISSLSQLGSSIAGALRSTPTSTPNAAPVTAISSYGGGSLGYSTPVIAEDALAYESGNYDATIPIGEGQISPYPSTVDYYAAAEGGQLIS